MAISSFNFHPYSEVCSCYRCYKSRGAMSESVYNSYRMPYGRREANMFGEVSRDRGKPTRHASGGIRATRHHQLARAPALVPTTSMCTSATLQDDFFEDFMRRLEPKIELLLEKACEELRRQQRELEREKTNAPGKEEEELPSSIVAEETSLPEEEEEEENLIMKEGGGSEEIVGQTLVPSLGNVEIPMPIDLAPVLKSGHYIRCIRLEVPTTTSSTQNLCFVKPIGVTKADHLPVITRRDSKQRDSSKPRPRKLIRWRISQFKYRRKSITQRRKLREGWPPYHQHQKSKVCRQWSRFLPLILCDLNWHTKGPKYDKEMEWITMKYEDFEDSRTNPFEEREYDVILISILKPRARRGRMEWAEVLSWLKNKKESS